MAAAEPLVISPRLVRVVKESGLICVSYWTINNDPSKVWLQEKQGIDEVIVDNVLAIWKGLMEAESKSNQIASGDGSLQLPGSVLASGDHSGLALSESLNGDGTAVVTNAKQNPNAKMESKSISDHSKLDHSKVYSSKLSFLRIVHEIA